jgi:hypothetical protein
MENGGAPLLLRVHHVLPRAEPAGKAGVLGQSFDAADRLRSHLSGVDHNGSLLVASVLLSIDVVSCNM